MECSAIVFSAYASSTNESLAVLTFIVLSCFARRDEITKERSGMAWYDLEQRRFGNFLERHLGRPAAGAFAAARLSIFLNLYGPPSYSVRKRLTCPTAWLSEVPLCNCLSLNSLG